MIGIIVTGHIHFASGLKSAVEAIAGQQEKIAWIDFTPDMSTEQLELALRQTLINWQPNSDVMIFTDLAGGSPCNRATALLTDHKNIRIITGSNLPMVVNACLERDGLTLNELTDLVLESGKSSINVIDSASFDKADPNSSINKIDDDL